MSKRERTNYTIEDEIKFLSIRPRKKSKHEIMTEIKKEIVKRRIETIKREREDDILNELILEKKRKIEQKEDILNNELKQKRLDLLYNSMYL